MRYLLSFDWLFENETLTMLALVPIAAIVLSMSYAIGYGLIDILNVVTLNQEQEQGGDPYVARIYLGLLFCAVAGIVFIIWDDREV